jgi:hypothetical protein
MIRIVLTGLDGVQRSTLERLVIRARALLEDDLAVQAEGRFGIHLSGTIEDESALPGVIADKVMRRDLEQIVAHLRTQGEEASAAVARLLRETAFTHLNRLVAIRIAEAIGLLPESLARGRQSGGFRDFGEIMPLLADDYRAYVRLCGDELAADAPALFDPRNPLLALEPTTAAFDELVALIADPAAAEIWTAPDALGWAYQFFNTGDERRAMREVPAPRNSRELAVRNQFFTPRYVVDFLVQNTLGRRLIENDPASALLDEMFLLVDPPSQPGPALNLDEVKCLDPACGSGHFLLGCYDILERAWEIAGVAPADSAPRIVSSLWGVDIDARCAQVASAAIVLRARRHCRDLPLPRPNIVTARGLPGGSAALPPDLRLTDAQRSLIDRISEVLADAPLLGVLLKAEEALDQEIRHGVFGGMVGGKPGMLVLTDESAAATERELFGHLQAIADQASSSVVERLLAAEADDALRLVEVVRQRYDAVLMNPPFGEPVPETKAYLRVTYPWRPTKDSNLLAAFVGRGLELCRADGYLGAITARSGMFLSGFEKWRREVLLGNRLTVLADLGFGVMEQAMVEAAAYTIGRGRAADGSEAVFIRLLRDTDRGGALTSAIHTERDGGSDGRVYRVPLGDFASIPGLPLAYWMSPSIRRLYTDLPQLEGHGAEARQGLATGDDFRFVRAFWEIDPRSIARTAAETHEGKRWCPFAKGGEYSPYWADIHLLVDYQREGEVLRSLPTSRVQNTQYFFRPGVTWPRRTNSAMGVRILPAGCVFADKGPAVLSSDPLLHLAWLNSRFVRLLVDSTSASADETQTGGVPSRSYEVGMVQSLPSPQGVVDDVGELKTAAGEIASLLAKMDDLAETSRRFVSPLPEGQGSRGPVAIAHSNALKTFRDASAVADLYAKIDRDFSDAVDPEHLADGMLQDASGKLVGLLPPSLSQAEQTTAVELFGADVRELIEAATASVGMARWIRLQHQIADRRLETMAVALGCHPSVLADVAEARQLLPPEEPRRSADDMFSYLVGVALGRWDVRIGRDPSLAQCVPDLFQPVALCSPGMLVGSDGMPATEAPAGYPLDLPPTQFLIDEPGHAQDIDAALIRAAAALFDDPATIIAELLEILGRNTVREHLRRQFFKDHLSRYSKSRRKAPIYWPLSVPSRNWGVWVYAPALTRETLYAIGSEAGRRERLAGEAIARLQREQHEGVVVRSARIVAEELEGEEKLGEELRRFRTEAERVAGLGWEPDLDDGIVLCAAPLTNLFPAWPEAKTARSELRKGRYEWATVAAWADQL